MNRIATERERGPESIGSAGVDKSLRAKTKSRDGSRLLPSIGIGLPTPGYFAFAAPRAFTRAFSRLL